MYTCPPRREIGSTLDVAGRPLLQFLDLGLQPGEPCFFGLLLTALATSVSGPAGQLGFERTDLRPQGLQVLDQYLPPPTRVLQRRFDLLDQLAHTLGREGVARLQDAVQHQAIPLRAQPGPHELLALAYFAGFAHIPIVGPVIGRRLVAHDQPHPVQVDDDPRRRYPAQHPLAIRSHNRVQLRCQRRDRLRRGLAQQRVDPEAEVNDACSHASATTEFPVKGWTLLSISLRDMPPRRM